MSAAQKRWLVALAALVAVGFALGTRHAEQPVAPRAVAAALPEPAAPSRVPAAAAQPRSGARSFTRTRLPEPGSHARRKVWLHARYGSGADELGKEVPAEEGEVLPPQGFTSTRDGQLVVLDSAKQRLVFFGPGGRMERVLPLEGLVAPADVAVARDGTLIVLDHEGVQTKGLLMLHPDGRKKAELPALRGALATGLYTVGNDVYLTKEGLATIKAGDTSGSASDETPGLYDDPDDGIIPGHVAPDGQTVVSAGIDSSLRGEFFVSAIRGEPPEHLFSRHFQAPGPLVAIPFVQSDGAGDLYVVLHDGERPLLLCLDGRTGDALGLVALPPPEGTAHGTPFRQFSVVQSGGLLYQELSDGGSTYEWFDCH